MESQSCPLLDIKGTLNIFINDVESLIGFHAS